MKKYLENDDDVEILETWKDLKEYLTFRAKHDEWVQPFINELAAIGIPNHPLFFQTNCTNLSVQKNGYRLDVKDIDYEDPENLSCIEDTGLFLVFPYKDSMAVYPTRRIVSGLTGLSRLSFFGTSIIITVSVILETKKLILSKTQENYYMNRVKKGGLFRG